MGDSENDLGGAGTDEVARLRWRVAELEALLRAHGVEIPAETDDRGAPSSLEVPASAAAPPTAPVPLMAPGGGSPSSPQGAVHPGGRAAAPGRGAPPTLPQPPAPEFERALGMRLAAVLGGIAVLAAVGYFIKYAIDIGLFGRVSDGVKFSLGLILAAALLAAGEIARRRVSIEASRAPFGAGVAALFVTIFGGVFFLDLFPSWLGGVLSIGGSIIGAGAAARSRSVAVGALGLIGGFGLPVSFGLVLDGSMTGAMHLTLTMIIALLMTALGTERFEILRRIALGAALPLGTIWFARSTDVPAVRALVAVIWWGLFAASSIVECFRGRHPRSSAVTLLLASSAAACGGAMALGAGNALTNPAAYLPLGVGIGLVVIAFQLRNPADDSDAPDEATAGAMRATHGLSRAAAVAAPIALLGAMGVFLEGGALAFAACVGCAGLLIATDRFSARALIPGAIMTGATGAIAAIAEVARGVTTAPVWLWTWKLEPSAAAQVVGSITEIRVASWQLVPMVCAIVLFIPLIARRWGSQTLDHVLAQLCGASGLLVALVVLGSGSGPWSFAQGAALIGLILVALRAPRWMGMCIGATSLAWMAWLLGVAILEAPRRPQVPIMLWLPCAALLPIIASWAIRLLAPPDKRIVVDVFSMSSLLLCLTLCIGLSSHQQQPLPAQDANTLPLVIACLAVGGALIAASLRRTANRQWLALAAWPLLVALCASSACGASVIVRGELPQVTGGGSLSALWLTIPAAVSAGASLIRRRSGDGAPGKPDPKLTALALIAILFGAMAALGAMSEGRPPSLVVIAPLALAASTFIWIGFHRSWSPWRWTGLALFTILSARLILIDLSSTPMPLRIGALLVTGLILVATSVAFARLKDAPSEAR